MITPEDKAKFLEKIREGNDRATAAFMVNPEYTGTMFKRLLSADSRSYDADFADAYDKAVAARGIVMMNRETRVRSETRPPAVTTSNGFTKAVHLTEDQLEQFLDKVSSGVQAADAAREIDPPTSITQIHRRCARDPDFANQFRISKEEGYPAYQEILRAEATRLALNGDYRALRDQLLMHVPEAKVLFTSKHEVGIDFSAIKLMILQTFPDLPGEVLDTIIAGQEKKERQALTA